MSDEKSFIEQPGFGLRRRAPALDEETALLLSLAEQLSPDDAVVLAAIIRRTGEIWLSDGEEVALAVLDQIEAILHERKPHS